ncbi:MAG: flagellar biosynthesis protein FlhF [Deltaproteobacteria bacterium]|nr:flagellar biosynthesis protein FlhF [Deltaproteobacteria bacterium]MBW2153628.1 flagellar biosynthesis protein FlhF [Deltaproteobacteria bacterium]
MAIKRYKAKSIQEAIRRIKEDFGPDAMILSTRRLPKDPRNPYGKDFFEVTAALKNETEYIALKETHCIDESLDKLGHHVEMQKPAAEKARRALLGEGLQALSAELFSIREMLFLIDQTGGLPEFLHRFPESLNLYARLVKSGISSRLAQIFMKRALDTLSDRPAGAEHITKRVLNEILSSISVLDPFSSHNNKQQVAAFIGPTGVGKTTTIAKLAAILSLQQKKTIGIISVDSYRIGAVDQLRTYAGIMGLPCLSAFSRQDLQKAVKQLQHKEIVLIDTAGQSHLDKDRMKALSRLMKGQPAISNHLVLSATTERGDMKEAAENFSILNPRTYVFTKLDETRRRGTIIDQVLEFKLPVSFITDGQRVPEDIQAANKESLLRLILRR